MITQRFLLGRGRDRMSADEKAALEAAAGPICTLGPREIVVRTGERVTQSMLLIEGFMCRYMDDRQGYRQLVAIQVPGDFVDLHGFPMRRLDHDIGTLGPVKIARFDHRALTRLTDRHPHLTRLLWFSTLLDAAQHREWIFRLGRLPAEGRVAHLMSELNVRLGMVGLAEGGTFTLPLTQADIAEACGLTSVHVNRVLRALREDNKMTFRGGVVSIVDVAGLAKLGEFEAQYLYGDHDAWGLPAEGEDA